MAARFNPPPGWQVPAGFRPEPGWSPDPAWPPAPAGWEYWTEVAASPPPPPPEPAAENPRTRSVARQGAAIPLPPGPLGHLRGDLVGEATPSPSGTAAPERRQRSGPPWLIPGVAVACLSLGVIIGVVASLAQASDAGQAAIDAQRAQTQVAQDRKDLDAQREDLEADKAALTQREKDLVARETAVSQKEAEQADLQTQLDQQRAEQAAQAQPSDQADGADGLGGGFPAGFQTCDQLRSDGYQTPISKGDPGYSRLLDRDRNGVACE